MHRNHRVFQALTNLREDPKRPHWPVSRLIERLRQALSSLPLNDLKEAPVSTEGRQIHNRIHHYLVANNLVLEHDLDAGSNRLTLDADIQPLAPRTSRDLLHSFVAMAVAIVHKHVKQFCLDQWMQGSVDDVDDRTKSPPPLPSHPEIKAAASNVLVPGCFQCDQ
jgi:hypothetical protein